MASRRADLRPAGQQLEFFVALECAWLHCCIRNRADFSGQGFVQQHSSHSLQRDAVSCEMGICLGSNGPVAIKVWFHESWLFNPLFCRTGLIEKAPCCVACVSCTEQLELLLELKL
uniref:Uncharacterized protein n=1 Tax=Eutreptiella gymnastica TaxID=73025 RepID=A0A7S4D0A2_9EUGL